MNLLFLLSAGMSLLLGVAGAWTVMVIGARSGLLDRPGHRSSHQIPTPKGGGIGILAAFIAGSIVIGLKVHFWLLVCMVSVVGLISDRKEITPQTRLLIQFLCALGIFYGTYGAQVSMSGPTIWLSILAGCIFIVGTANFYNFMDGINGIAAITAIVSYGLGGYYLHFSGHDSHFAWLMLYLVLGVLGFLPFNLPNAKVFMGDVGSILLGFLYGCIVVLSSKSWVDFICMASFLFLFYADEITTMIIRISKGENLLKAHRRHLYQILANELKQPHWVVSIGYGFFQLIIGVTVLSVASHGLCALLATLFFYSAIFTGLTVWVRNWANAR